MPRAQLWDSQGRPTGHIDFPDTRPAGPPGPILGPVASLLGAIIVLAILIGMAVLVIGAANAPNPGEPGYVRPGSSQSAPPLNPPTDWTVPQ